MIRFFSGDLRHWFLCTEMSSRVVEVASMPGRIVKDLNGVFVPMASRNKGMGSKGMGKKARSKISTTTYCHLLLQ